MKLARRTAARSCGRTRQGRKARLDRARLGATSEGSVRHDRPRHTRLALRGRVEISAFSAKLLGTVPADALVYLSFHGSKGMFDGLGQNPVLNTPEFRQFAQPLRQIGRVLEGENAIYARPGARIPEVTLVSTPSTAGTPILDRMVKRFRRSPRRVAVRRRHDRPFHRLERASASTTPTSAGSSSSPTSRRGSAASTAPGSRSPTATSSAPRRTHPVCPTRPGARCT
jgi:hypothetical protein